MGNPPYLWAKPVDGVDAGRIQGDQGLARCRTRHRGVLVDEDLGAAVGMETVAAVDFGHDSGAASRFGTSNARNAATSMVVYSTSTDVVKAMDRLDADLKP